MFLSFIQKFAKVNCDQSICLFFDVMKDLLLLFLKQLIPSVIISAICKWCANLLQIHSFNLIKCNLSVITIAK